MGKRRARQGRYLVLAAAGGVGLALGLGRLVWGTKAQPSALPPRPQIPPPGRAAAGLGEDLLTGQPPDDSDWHPQPVEDPSQRRQDGRIADLSEPPVAELVKVQDIRLTKPAADGYLHMLAAARREGIESPLLTLASGYRGLEKQQTLWQQGLQKYKARLTVSLGRTPTEAEIERETRKWVAPAGSSAHQTGRAIDLELGTPIDSRYVAAGRQTGAYQWLAANAVRFGFYPYPAEPWHWEFNPP